MIYDTLKNISQYLGISSNLDKAIYYIKETDLNSLEAGKHIIDGDNVFALAQRGTTVSRTDARWEAHKKYIDIQFLLSGPERIGFQKEDDLAVSTEYSPERDIAFYEDNDEGFFVQLQPNSFVICFPSDAHMPLVNNREQPIKKIVIKVKVD